MRSWKNDIKNIYKKYYTLRKLEVTWTSETACDIESNMGSNFTKIIVHQITTDIEKAIKEKMKFSYKIRKFKKNILRIFENHVYYPFFYKLKKYIISNIKEKKLRKGIRKLNEKYNLNLYNIPNYEKLREIVWKL